MKRWNDVRQKQIADECIMMVKSEFGPEKSPTIKPFEKKCGHVPGMVYLKKIIDDLKAEFPEYAPRWVVKRNRIVVLHWLDTHYDKFEPYLDSIRMETETGFWFQRVLRQKMTWNSLMTVLRSKMSIGIPYHI